MSWLPFSDSTIKAATHEAARLRLEHQFGNALADWMLRELRKTLRAAANGRYYTPSDEELAKMLMPFLTDAASLGAEAGVAPLLELGMSCDEHLVNQAAVDFARKWIYNGYDKGLSYAINDTTRKIVQKEVASWIAEPGHKQQDLIKRLLPTFGPKRAKTIAVTEITNAYAGGAIESWREINRQAGVTVITGKQWRTANDERVCPVCAPLGGLTFDVTAQPQSAETQEANGQVTGIGDMFTHPGGGGMAARFKDQTYYRPPAHPRCRCNIIPYMAEIPDA